MIKIPEEIKALFKKDNVQKNIRIHFPNGEHKDITNENVIEESMVFTESICSSENLKFGLCEASVFQIETVGVGNIKGCTIEVDLEVAYNLPDVIYTDFDSYETTGGLLGGTSTVVKTIKGLQKEISIRFVAPSMQQGYSCKIKIENLDTGETTTTDEFFCLGSATIKQLCGAGEKVVTIYLYDSTVTVESITVVAESGLYPVPIGTFVVDSCTKQYNKNRRYVIAYTSEIQWDMLPNPLERAKTNGLMDLKYDSPYKFNIAAVAYANAYMGATDYFEDKTLNENAETFKNFHGHIFYSSAIARSPSGEQSTPKYYGYVYFESAYVPISSNEEADNLYWLNYQDAINIENFKTIYEEVYGNAQYEWEEGYAFLNLDEIMQALKYGYYNYKKYHYPTSLYESNQIPLDNHRYVYPFMNYTTTEESIYKETAITEKTAIIVPYNARIEVWESSIDNSGNVTRKAAFSETVSIRDAENIKFYTINNLPQMRMSINRKMYKKGSNKGYRVDTKEIEVRNIVEAHSELNGFFGKNNRDGSIEFVKINASHCLYPSETLYPSEELFPNETNGGILSPTYYMDVWSEDNYTKPYGKVEVTYRNANEEEVYAYYSLVDEEADDYSADKYQAYSLSDNYLINTCTFAEEDINKILETVAESLKDVQYMPSEITLKGLPYVEAGDFISVLTKNDGFETYIMRRTMTGIKSLIDTFEATGEELCKNTTNATTRMERGS